MPEKVWGKFGRVPFRRQVFWALWACVSLAAAVVLVEAMASRKTKEEVLPCGGAIVGGSKF